MDKLAEVFPNPTVNQVIFQIRYPNLFFLESKIGDLQLKLMPILPKASLVYRRQIILGEVEQNDELPKDLDTTAKKVWSFSNDNGMAVHITGDSLSITSTFHKTYSHESGSEKFRNVISQVVGSFLEIVKIPKIVRMGLRYIDHCPVAGKNTERFSEYYNSALPISRFPLESIVNMNQRVLVNRDDCKLIYSETIEEFEKDKWRLVLDFDGYIENFDSAGYLSLADRLHDVISTEFFVTIKQPLVDYMRGSKS